MYIGDFTPGKTVVKRFNSHSAAGTPATLSGTPAISVYKTGSTTESTTGVSLTVDYDGRTGLNYVAIDTSADGTFYASGSDFDLVITTGTVDSVSVVGSVVGTFSLSNRAALRPTTADRTLDVSSTGEAGIDWANIGSPTTTVALSGTTAKANITQVGGTNIPTAVVAGALVVDIGYVLGSTATSSAGDITNGTAQAGAAGTITLASGASSTDDLYKGNLVTITSGTGTGQTRTIAGYVGSTKVATVDWNWVTTPDSTSVYSVLPADGPSVNSSLQVATTSSDPWSTALPGAYSSGTAGYLIGNNVSQTGDSYAIVNHASYGNSKLVRATTPANTLDVSATGEAGLDFSNIKDASSAHTLTNITVPAVTAVTGSVGSVTGNVGGNVVGSVASVAGAVGSVTGSIGGDVAGSVGSIATNGITITSLATGAITAGAFAQAAADKVWSTTTRQLSATQSFNNSGNWTGNLSGTVGSVTGAVGSVTGNVGGNVVGSVASVTGSVGSVTGAVGSVTGAVGSVTGSVGSLATQAKTDAENAVWNAAHTSHTTAGTFGNYLDSAVSGVSTGGLSVSAIATAVWQDTTSTDFTVLSSIGKRLTDNITGDAYARIGTSGAGLTSVGLASTQTFSNTGTWTGSLTGSVGSVTGAVGSVTGSVGSVAGNVGGNVVGTVASVTGAVGSVAGNVGGNVTGSVGSVATGGIVAGSFGTGAIDATAFAQGAADKAWGTTTRQLTSSQTFNLTGNVTGNLSGSVGSVTGAVGSVTGAVASVTGAVGSVTGNVGGNVVGSVASVAGAVGSVTGSVGGNVTGSVGSLATQAKTDVENAVWNASHASHTTSGTFGNYIDAAISGVASGGLTASAIATAVWQDTTSGDFTTVGSIGKRLADNITGDAYARIGANGAGLTSVSLAAAGLDSVAIESGINARQALALIGSASAGKASGLDTNTPIFKGMGNTTTRVSATTDSSGNRASVTLSPPA